MLGKLIQPAAYNMVVCHKKITLRTASVKTDFGNNYVKKLRQKY